LQGEDADVAVDVAGDAICVTWLQGEDGGDAKKSEEMGSGGLSSVLTRPKVSPAFAISPSALDWDKSARHGGDHDCELSISFCHKLAKLARKLRCQVQLSGMISHKCVGVSDGIGMVQPFALTISCASPVMVRQLSQWQVGHIVHLSWVRTS
jgi:hypothetical protein